MEENEILQVHVVTGKVPGILKHILILLKILTLILFNVDEILSGRQLAILNQYVPHRSTSASKAL